MHENIVDAVCKLIDAVLYEHCVATDGDWRNTEATVECALAALEKIRVSAEFSSRHGWADQQLTTYHAGDRRPHLLGPGLNRPSPTTFRKEETER